jgi:hypothetical protein
VSVGTASATARRGAGTATTDRARALARPALIGLAALTVLAAAVRFYRLGHQGFWYDEAVSALLVHFPLGKMFGLLPRSESTPPLYYCIAWVWVRVFGDAETGLRSLSAVVGVAVVPAIYGAAARLVSVRAGLIAAALAACNPLLIWYSQEARAYELLVLLSALSLLAFAHVLERPARGWAAAWAVSAGLALATEYYAILVVVPQALWLLYRNRRSRPVLGAIAFAALCGLALVPLIVRENQNGLSHWIAKISLARRLREILPQFVIGFGSPAYAVLEPLALALAALGIALLLAPAARERHHKAHLAGGLALAGFVITLLLIAVGIDDLLTRNLLALWMPAALAVAAGLAVARPRMVGVVATAVMCGCGVAGAVDVATNRDLEKPDWRVVARVIGPSPAASVAAGGGRAILVQHYRDLLPLSLYVHGLRFMPRRGATVSELDVVSFTTPDSAGFCWWGPGCNLWPSRMQATYRIPRFHAVWRRHALRFTILRLVPAHPVRLTPHAVARALHTTHYRNDELLIQR